MVLHLSNGTCDICGQWGPELKSQGVNRLVHEFLEECVASLRIQTDENARFKLCQGCGVTYDSLDSSVVATHEGMVCSVMHSGECIHCGQFGSNMSYISSPLKFEHMDLRECLAHLKEQFGYWESHCLEHDARYTQLEAAVTKLTVGRRAAIKESATLQAIREAHDD